MELLETLVSHVVAGVIGAGIIWYPNRSIKRQFFSMMEAIDAGKEQGKEWKFLRDDSGELKGFRLIMGASARSDNPNAM
jgi:hypothetical protein